VASPTVTRRTVLSAGAAAGAVAATGISLSEASAAMTWRVPKRADDLVNAFGIDIHLNHQSSMYGNHSEVAKWLGKLGVRHVRSRLSLLPSVLDAFEDLAQQGIKVQGTCGALGDPQTMGEIMGTVKHRYNDPHRIFSAFEGINEPNNDGVRWTDETRTKTRGLHAARANHGLTNIPIVAPALARVTSGGVEGNTTWEQAGRLGDLSSSVNYGNMHVYPRGLPPSTDIAYFRSCSRRVTGWHDIMCTEGGYFTAMGYQGGPNPVPEKVAAVYGPQALLEHWIAGTKRFFRYELLDDPYPSSTDREGTLGMIRTGSVWTPKPDFAPMRHLLQAFSDRGPKFTPRPLEMSLADRPANFRSALFARRNGVRVLAMWLDKPIYNPGTRNMLVNDLRAPWASVRLNLGSRHDLKIRHLTDLGSPAKRYSTRSTRIGLTPGLTLVTIY